MNGHRGTEPASWQDHTRHLTSRLNELWQLRRDLAQLELRHDRSVLRRVSWVGGSGALLLLVGLPLLLTAAALGLSHITEISFATWCIIIGSVLIVPGTLMVLLAARKIRTEFLGFRNTLAELQEDIIWLQEWGGWESPESIDDSCTGHPDQR